MGGIHAILLGVLRLSVDDAIDRAENIYGALDARLASSRHVTSFSWSGISSWQSKNSIALTSALYYNLVDKRTDSDLSAEKVTRPMKKDRRRSSMQLDDDFCRTYVL